MGILNVTPDSFSDGSAERSLSDGKDTNQSSLNNIIELAKQLVADGADIIDIGGMSTRPGVQDTDVSVQDELARVIPVIQALRIEGFDVPISIDTFRPEVAEGAILAGASCINDVRGGKETGMLEVMARLDVPVVLMHTRGNSVEMTTQAAQDYRSTEGVVKGVQKELMETVMLAERAGVKRWNIILDPGIGFAKTQQGNLQLLSSLEQIFEPGSGLDCFSTLVGASRKGFIGAILGKSQPRDREWGNAAITARCAHSGVVDIIRVHEPAPALDVIKMSSAMFSLGETERG